MRTSRRSGIGMERGGGQMRDEVVVEVFSPVPVAMIQQSCLWADTTTVISYEAWRAVSSRSRRWSSVTNGRNPPTSTANCAAEP